MLVKCWCSGALAQHAREGRGLSLAFSIEVGSIFTSTSPHDKLKTLANRKFHCIDRGCRSRPTSEITI